MSIMPLLTMALGVTGPVAIQPNWVTIDDYPDREMRADIRGAAVVRTLVDSTGRPVTCTVEQELGQGRFGTATCKATLKRAKFQPARDATGAPVAGVFRSIHNFVLPGDILKDGFPKLLEPDLSLPVAAAPGNREPIVVQVVTVVNATGDVESCVPDATERRAAEGRLACSQIMASFKPDLVRSPKGDALRYAQAMRVRFVPQPS